MTVRGRLWLGFGILLLLVAIGCGVGFLKSRSAEARCQEMVRVNLAEQNSAEECLAAMLQAQMSAQKFVQRKDTNAISQVAAAIKDAKQKLQDVATSSPNESRRKEAATASNLADQYSASFNNVVRLATRRGLTQNSGLEGELRKAVHNVEAKVKDQGLAELSVVMLMCRRHEKDYLLRGDPQYLKDIATRIEEFSAQMKQFSFPDALQNDIAAQWKVYYDAMKAILEADNAIRTETANFERVDREIGNNVNAISEAAKGEMRTSEAAVLGQLASGKKALLVVLVLAILVGFATAYGITRNLTRVTGLAVRSIQESADQVAAASHQVTSASQSLAEGASEQAASLEETSASLEEMAGMTKNNAVHAQSARELANQTRTAADAGVNDIQAMTSAMDAIKSSSDNIAKIIRTIDEIAFQTNLLAINAAVEAARAGGAGMGFAVVADEVRALAQRSAQAAKETADKIADSIRRGANGVEISARVATRLQEIVEKVRKLDGYVTEIATASQEQSQGVTQINTAVVQMDKVTQSNAANAEESASAAEELNAQAVTLKESVASLMAFVGGEGATAKTKPGRAVSKAKPQTGAWVATDEAEGTASHTPGSTLAPQANRKPTENGHPLTAPARPTAPYAWA